MRGERDERDTPRERERHTHREMREIETHTHIYIYIYIYIYTHTHTYIYIYIYKYTHIYKYIYICVCVCIYIYMDVFLRSQMSSMIHCYVFSTSVFSCTCLCVISSERTNKLLTLTGFFSLSVPLCVLLHMCKVQRSLCPCVVVVGLLV